MTYKKYLKNTMIAQFLYMLTLLTAFFILMLIPYLLIFGSGFEFYWRSNIPSESGVQYATILIGVIIYSMMAMIPLSLIATLSPVFLKNKYIIQFLPILFVIGTLVLVYNVGNINDFFATLTLPFLFQNAIGSLSTLISPRSGFIYQHHYQRAVFNVIFYPTFLWAVTVILYKLNVKRFGKDYLL
jgi:hypothetical protein